ncbi:MAG: hypothetical protein ACP5NQ_08320 [Vulcanisaeta sp.]
MRVLRIIYFEIKQLYRRWYVTVFWLAFSVFMMYYSFYTGNHGEDILEVTILFYLNFFAIISILSSYASVSRTFVITKSVVDVIFMTEIDPLEYVIARSIATGLIYPMLFLALTVFAVRPGLDIIYYVASLLLMSGFIVLFITNVQLSPWRIKLPLSIPILTILSISFFKPKLSPFYGLISPSPIYVAYALALFVIALFTIPKQYIRELYTNAYGLLNFKATLEPRQIGKGKLIKTISFPGTQWGVIWFTSAYTVNIHSGVRFNILKRVTLISISFAIPYCVVALIIRGMNYQLIASVLSFYIIYVMLYSVLSTTISNERLWLSLSMDPYRYFKYRMGARTIMTTIASMPWIAAYVVQSIFFKPVLFLAMALVSVIMTMPVLGWLIAAYIGVPQVRELLLPQRDVVHSLRMYLVFAMFVVTLGIYMVPYALAVVATFYPVFTVLWLIGTVFAAIILASSVAFFYYAIFSKRSQAMWAWLVSRLSENGYM